MFKILLLAILLLPFCSADAQQKKRDLQLLRLYEDDDFLNFRGEGTDRYYTSGTKIDFYYTQHSRANFLDKLLITTGETADNLYGYGITHQIYTPNDIRATNILYGDRPYAGVLYLNHSLVSSDAARSQRLTTEFGLGVLGRYSFAEQVQTAFHRLIHYQVPLGWHNQVASDIVVNYLINFEKLVFKPAEKLEIIGSVGANTGTLSNFIDIGLTFRAGTFNSYFCNYEKPGTMPSTNLLATGLKRYQFYFYMRPIFRAVMDDSVLQGGFFTHNSSPYTISKDSISRANLQYEYGIVFGHNRFGIAASEKLRTAEYTGGPVQQIGNITLYIGL